MTKAEKAVETVCDDYYNKHHDFEFFKKEIARVITEARIRGFSETKRRVTEALDYRISQLSEGIDALKENHECVSVVEDYDIRRDELYSIRAFIRGMVVEVNEKSTT